MSSLSKNRTWAAGPLTAIILLAMWGNALAAVFCPHMSGGKCCFVLQPRTHPEGGSRDASPARPMHAHHQHTADMEMADTSMDMGHAHDASAESEVNSERTIGNDPGPVDEDVEAVTQANDPCSHCAMHLRTADRFAISFVAGIGADTVVLANTGATKLALLPSAYAPVEVRDHSPPGSSAPLYVLAASFRI